MKTFEIEVSGKTLSEVVNAIEEAKKRIEQGNYAGFDENEDGSFSFDSDGCYEEEEEN